MKRLGGLGVLLLVLNEIRGVAVVAGLLSAWSGGSLALPRSPHEAARLMTCVVAATGCSVRTADGAAPGAGQG